MMIYSEGFSMKNRINLLLAAMMFWGSGLALAGESAVIAAASGLSLREKPARNAKLIVKLRQGTKIEVIDRNGPEEQIEGKRSNWFKVVRVPTLAGHLAALSRKFIATNPARLKPPEKSRPNRQQQMQTKIQRTRRPKRILSTTKPKLTKRQFCDGFRLK